MEALFAVDAAMADVVRTTREPMVGQIRLAWWRERLEDLDKGLAVPPEPRLKAVAGHLLPQGISGEDLAALETAWLTLLSTPFPWTGEIVPRLAERGTALFHQAGRLLGCSAEPFKAAGAVWSIVDIARHCSDERSRTILIEEARRRLGEVQDTRFRAPLRPLSALAALAGRDLAQCAPFEAEGTPGRALAILRHCVTGRLPQVHLTRTAP